jgi:hypothetical protein
MNSPALVRPPFSRPLHGRRGLSLMELLIATTISIMIMGATVTLFGVVGERINGGRAMIEVSDRLRSTQNLLLRDLRGATVSFLPWEQASAGSGYFEILKGPASLDDPSKKPSYNRDPQPDPPNSHDQKSSLPPGTPSNVVIGYTQDVLMLTTRSPDAPFTGRFLPTVAGASPTTIESQIAEVAWYLQPTFNAAGQQPIPPTYTLYRRQLLLYPSPTPLKLPTTVPSPMVWFYDNYDISSHPDGKGNMIANSLADLAYRENRFAHHNLATNIGYPYPVIYPSIPAPGMPWGNKIPMSWGNPIPPDKTASAAAFNADSLMPFQPTYYPGGGTNPVGSQRYGEDVLLTNVLSFDVKVWDPGAAVLPDSSQRPLVPSDKGYNNEFINWKAKNYPANWNLQPVQYGAYVDLNYMNNFVSYGGSVPPSYFAGPHYGSNGTTIPALSATNFGYSSGGVVGNHWATYDSWSSGYEYYNSSMTAAQYNHSNNGFDNDGNGIVNDPGERVTTSPYPVPLRGVQIKIRVYEPSTRQVREITVSETFLPD